jgi:hypothetical protein
MASNLNSTNNLVQTGSEIRYSPLSPHYPNFNQSPNRGISPGNSNRHYSGMSPSYSYNSPSSPNYSPNSSGTCHLTIGSPSLSQQNSGSSLHTPASPYGGFKQTYNPESPAYHYAANLIRRKDDKYSDDEEEEEN